MDAIVCPHCRLQVVPTAEGVCPSCRQTIAVATVGSSESKPCPACGAAMRPGAVLCIACGYHSKIGGQLATVLDDDGPQPIDPNPYASPEGPAETYAPRGRGPYNDLTPGGARQAEAVVRDAESVGKVLLFTLCCCSIAWPLIFPWYAFRLVSWYSLNAQYNELRFPNSFSNHGALAARFQDAKLRLWIGTIVGVVFGTLVVLALVSRIAQEM